MNYFFVGFCVVAVMVFVNIFLFSNLGVTVVSRLVSGVFFASVLTMVPVLFSFATSAVFNQDMLDSSDSLVFESVELSGSEFDSSEFSKGSVPSFVALEELSGSSVFSFVDADRLISVSFDSKDAGREFLLERDLSFVEGSVADPGNHEFEGITHVVLASCVLSFFWWIGCIFVFFGSSMNVSIRNMLFVCFHWAGFSKPEIPAEVLRFYERRKGPVCNHQGVPVKDGYRGFGFSPLAVSHLQAALFATLIFLPVMAVDQVWLYATAPMVVVSFLLLKTSFLASIRMDHDRKSARCRSLNSRFLYERFSELAEHDKDFRFFLAESDFDQEFLECLFAPLGLDGLSVRESEIFWAMLPEFDGSVSDLVSVSDLLDGSELV